MNNNDTIVKVKTPRTFDFEDVKGVHIPNKITCPKCGREVMGHPPLVQERIYKFFGGSWTRYQNEWMCSECKKKTNGTVSGKLAEIRKLKKIEEAIQLLETEGYIVTKEDL